MTRGYFITGIGTNVGKTMVTSSLVFQLRNRQKVVALKPVISGFSWGDAECDPAVLLRAAGVSVTRDSIAAISPWRYGAALSPHLAARTEGNPASSASIAEFCTAHAARSEIVLVEGAGGIMSPLNERETMLDLITQLRYPAIIVTATYLGAMSHTLTALATLKARGLEIAAIVISESEDSASSLAEMKEAIALFSSSTAPIYTLPRIAGDEKWRKAPALSDICA